MACVFTGLLANVSEEPVYSSKTSHYNVSKFQIHLYRIHKIQLMTSDSSQGDTQDPIAHVEGYYVCR